MRLEARMGHPQGLRSGVVGKRGVTLSAVCCRCSCSKPALTTSRCKLQAGQQQQQAWSLSHPQAQSNMLFESNAQLARLQLLVQCRK